MNETQKKVVLLKLANKTKKMDQAKDPFTPKGTKVDMPAMDAADAAKAKAAKKAKMLKWLKRSALATGIGTAALGGGVVAYKVHQSRKKKRAQMRKRMHRYMKKTHA